MAGRSAATKRDNGAIGRSAAIIRSALVSAKRRPLIAGICGAQGIGKSTIAAELTAGLNTAGISAATLSLDDLYLGKAARTTLARDVHPLLRTRGVPGTHDIALGLTLFGALDRGEAVRLPRFDKASDDRCAETGWAPIDPSLQVLLFEGWCVGALPQASAALAEPVNALEREADADGRWRRYVNAQLEDGYQALFARLDLLILLAAPGFAAVLDWRREQEAQLRQHRSGPDIMSDGALRRFVEHYERLTRHILNEMPGRADLTIQLAADRSVHGVIARAAAATPLSPTPVVA